MFLIMTAQYYVMRMRGDYDACESAAHASTFTLTTRHALPCKFPLSPWMSMTHGTFEGAKDTLGPPACWISPLPNPWKVKL